MAERNLELHGVIYHVENGKLEVVESTEEENRLKKRLAAFTTKDA
jgi:carbonic anhydrase